MGTGGRVSPAKETENQGGNVRGLPRTSIRGTKGVGRGGSVTRPAPFAQRSGAKGARMEPK